MIKRETNICSGATTGKLHRFRALTESILHRRTHKLLLSLCTFQLLQDTQLISLICVLLLIDCLMVTLWVTLDPMQRHLRNLTLEISPQDRGVVYQPQVTDMTERSHSRSDSVSPSDRTPAECRDHAASIIIVNEP